MLTFALTEGMQSRVASSICKAVECEEMICSSYTDYSRKAVQLAVGTLADLDSE